MNYLIVDDNPLIVEDLVYELVRIDPEAMCHPFTDAQEAHEFALVAPPGYIHVALLDIEMPDMDGLTLAEALTERFSLVNIIFVTGYGHYALDAHRLYASGFLVKPFSSSHLRSALAHLRHPVMTGVHLNPKAVGERIDHYRSQAGMTRKELADAMSVTVQTVGRWELGNRMPNLSTIVRLSQVLGVNLEALMTGESGTAPEDIGSGVL